MSELAENIYGQSWESTLREAHNNATEQPETDSEGVVEQGEQETVEEVEESTEGVDEQPETDSEPNTPTFNDDTEIEMGEDRKGVKLSELKQGYLRQSDYTKKSQELATQRKEVEAQSEKLKPVQEWLTYMDNNPWVFGQIDQALKEYHSTGALPLQEVLQDAQYGQYVNHLMAENKRIQSELDSIRGEYEGVKLNSEFTSLRNELKGEYGDLVTDDYMQSLQERAKQEKLSFSILKDIADGHLAKQKLKTQPSTKQTEAKAIQKLQETRKQAPAAPKTSAQSPSSPEKADTSGDWIDFLKRSRK